MTITFHLLSKLSFMLPPSIFLETSHIPRFFFLSKSFFCLYALFLFFFLYFSFNNDLSKPFKILTMVASDLRNLHLVASIPEPIVDGDPRMAPNLEVTELLSSQVMLPYSLGDSTFSFVLLWAFVLNNFPRCGLLYVYLVCT